MTSTKYAIAHEDIVYGIGMTVSDAMLDAQRWFDEAGISLDDDRNDVYRITDKQFTEIANGNVSLMSLGVTRAASLSVND